MTENSANTPTTKRKAKCLKIVTTPDHDIERVRRILLKFHPEYLILESKTKTCNYKTLHIAQGLRKEGCRDVGMKFYKGELLKVQMSIGTAETKVSAICQGTIPDRVETNVSSACSRVNTRDHPVEFQNGEGAPMSDIDHKSVG
jgi:hypothetical protein